MAFVKKFLPVCSIFLNILLCVFIYSNRIEAEAINIEKTDGSYWLGRDDIFDVLTFKKGGIVFLGDSHIENFELSEFFNRADILNRGIVGDSLASVQKRLHQIIGLEPRALFIEIGVNDIASGFSIENMVPKYDNILKTLHTKVPKCKLFIISILPTSVEKEKFPQYCNRQVNQKIIVLNGKLQKLCKENNCTYIDFHKEIFDGAGLSNDLTVDGVHLSGKAYHAWYSILKPYIN